MKTTKLFLLATVALSMAVASCSNDDNDENPQPVICPTDSTSVTPPTEDSTWVYEWHPAKAITLTTSQQDIARRLSTFSWQLFAELYKLSDNGTKNIIYSPFSVETDFGMVLNGMQGTAKEELLNLLGLSNTSTDDLNNFFAVMSQGIDEADNMTRFTSANSLWYAQDHTLNADFQNALQTHYGAEIFPVTFTSATANDINKWCFEKTNGRIPSIVGQTSSLDLMHLINAVYFRSNWADHFNEVQTTNAPFTTAAGDTQEVSMMQKVFSHEVLEFDYTYNDCYEQMVIPFNNGAYRMAFILPRESSSIGEVIAHIAQNDIVQQRPDDYTLIHLELPKFKVSSNYDLKNVLTQMGCTLFSADNDCFHFFEQDNRTPTGIVHKAFLQIDEKGAEAAAATDIFLCTSDGTEPTYTDLYLTFNRPFLYTIIESSTGYPLFMGYISHIE